jgi:MraZ protein
MFLGDHQHTLDPKGRVILPAAFRDELAEGVVMTVGMDTCIVVHPTRDWDRVVDGLRALQTTDAKQRRFVRAVLANAHPGELDKQGRITIPARLRAWAGLTKDVAVIGQDLRVELWDRERWDGYNAEALADFAETDQTFGPGIF